MSCKKIITEARVAARYESSRVRSSLFLELAEELEKHEAASLADSVARKKLEQKLEIAETVNSALQQDLLEARSVSKIAVAALAGIGKQISEVQDVAENMFDSGDNIRERLQQILEEGQPPNKVPHEMALVFSRCANAEIELAKANATLAVTRNALDDLQTVFHADLCPPHGKCHEVCEKAMACLSSEPGEVAHWVNHAISEAQAMIERAISHEQPDSLLLARANKILKGLMKSGEGQ